MYRGSIPDLRSLDVAEPIWDRFFTVAPLVVIGTRDADGRFDLAPKHLAGPMGWENYFGFVCTSEHATYRNVRRESVFTVSFPDPSQIVPVGQAAAPRDDDGLKASIDALDTFPASVIDGVLLEGATLHLECRLEKCVDGMGPNSLLIGRILAAAARPDVLRDPEVDDQELIARSPLLAYLSPGRFCDVSRSFSFPFPMNFKR